MSNDYRSEFKRGLDHGKRDSRASILDQQILHGSWKKPPLNPEKRQAYNKGYEKGNSRKRR